MDYLKKGFSMAKEGAVAAAEKTKAGVEGAAAKTKEGVMYVGNKTKDGMVAGVNTVAQRTTDQANIVGDATVAGANELSQQTVEGMENAAVNSGLVNQVSHILSFHIVKMMANPSPLLGTVGWTVGGGWNRDSYNRLEISLAIPGEETSTGPSFNSLILVSKTLIFPS
uniref:Synuclein gamma n=1 Tax=Salmo trutta TaxID=8032 RepID=A0A674BFC0_SALTR